MAYWLEIHCDVRCEPKIVNGNRQACRSFNNQNPCCGTTNSNLKRALKLLRKQAKSENWKKTKRGWECPYCQVQR